MQTHEEMGLRPDADACLRRALSVFRTKEGAEHQARLFRRWKKKYVARVNLTADHGRTKATGGTPGHISWWPAAELTPPDRARLFAVVSEVGT